MDKSSHFLGLKNLKNKFLGLIFYFLDLKSLKNKF